MGLLDSLTEGIKGVLGQAEAAGVPEMLNAALAKTSMGNLQGVVNQLQASGLGAQVQSWLGSGANLPVTADELKAALGNDQVRQLAQHFGVDPDTVLKLLSNQLPAAVDAASPNGSVAAAS
jgi:uncharacterized protein YidB (DUF937 family)